MFTDTVLKKQPFTLSHMDFEEFVSNLWQVDPWFTQVCQKIDYLFPEAHSLSFAILLVRLVWYIIHQPEVGSLLIEECSCHSL